MSVTVDDPDIVLFDGSDWRTYDNAPGGWYGGTYHETCDDRDDLTIAFKGSGIRIYGAKRPNYGYYYAEMDGENRRFFNAHSLKDEIPALLFEMSGMNDGDHSLWMMNQQNYGGQRTRSCWGIDYMVITSGSNINRTSASTTDRLASAPAPSPVSSVDPALEPETTEASETEVTSASASSTPIGQAGSPITASSTTDALTVPNLSNFTQPPSADEVVAPSSTYGTGTLTAVTGQPGVYSGQALPVYTGQALNTFGANPPNLKQEAFVTGIMAGSSNAAQPVREMPIICFWVWLVGIFLVRGLRA